MTDAAQPQTAALPTGDKAMKSRHYIVVMRNTDIWLVGPFETNMDAADYGATAEAKTWGGDPRWQTIKLVSTFGLRIEKPVLTVAAGAYERAFRPVCQARRYLDEGTMNTAQAVSRRVSRRRRVCRVALRIWRCGMIVLAGVGLCAGVWRLEDSQ